MVNVVATVEKVSNGFVVDFAGAKFVATDCIDLASVFEEVFEVPEQRVDLTPAGRAALEGLDLRTGEELLVEHLLEAERQKAEGESDSAPADNVVEWPSVPTAPASDEQRATSNEGSAAEMRVPVADDGYEYPAVKQLGANHFVVACPGHGEQRMERRGAAWVCPRKEKNAECTTRIPREAMQRALRAA